mgnify:CR=1 FL=1
MTKEFTCHACQTQLRVAYENAPREVFLVACPKCGQRYKLRKPVAVAAPARFVEPSATGSTPSPPVASPEVSAPKPSPIVASVGPQAVPIPTQSQVPHEIPPTAKPTEPLVRKRNYKPWLIGVLGTAVLGGGIYGGIELSKRHTLTETERAQAEGWFSDLREKPWVLVAPTNPAAKEYTLTCQPAEVSADNFGKTTIRLELELLPANGGAMERYSALEERPYSDLAEPAQLFMSDGNDVPGAGTSIMLRRVARDSLLVEFRDDEGPRSVLAGIPAERFIAMQEAAILFKNKKLIHAVDSMAQNGGLVRRGLFRSYGCGDECVAIFLIVQNGQPVNAAYVCNNNRFGDIQLSQGDMLGTGDFTNPALVGRSFLIVTRRTRVEMKDGEPAQMDVVTGLLPIADEDITPELQQRLAVATNLDQFIASDVYAPGPAASAQEFLIDAPVVGMKDVEELPQYPGGEADLYKFLAQVQEYPQIAVDAGIQGTVIVTFLVDKDGNVKNPKVLRGLGSGLDEAAIRMVKKMPAWEPGKLGGVPVNVQYNLSIRFSLR